MNLAILRSSGPACFRFCAMNPLYAPQRRLLLSIQQEESGPEPALIRTSEHAAAADPGRQSALSVPESIRALGEPLDPFFEACGGRQILSVAVRRTDDGTPVSTYLFQQPFVLIGRCTESDLSLRHETVGFRHLYLQLVSGRWSYVNLARLSNVATTRDDSSSGWFDPGDELSIGPYTIRHVVPDSNRLVSPTSTSSGPAIHSPPIIQLDLLNGRSELQHRRSRQIDQPITLIGSGRKCDLWLRDESVSTIHASLVRTPRGAWIVDLLGRNGMWVDDRAAYWKQIHDGSKLQIGRFQIRVKFVSEPGAPPEQPSNATDTGAVHRKRRRRKARGGSLSENAMLALVRQLAEMQSQFFEHSQLQMQLMSEMLAHLGRDQQAHVRRDLSRIDEIGRELKDLQLQLAQPDRRSESKSASGRHGAAESQSPVHQESTAVDSPTSPDTSALPDTKATNPTAILSEVNTPSQSVDSGQAVDSGLESCAPESAAESQTPATVFDSDVQPPGEEPSDQPVGESTESIPPDGHARLTRRMARLAQERNNRWRRVLQAFKRKPAD
jgi:hypothetical protein